MIDREDENHELDDFIRDKLNNIHVAFDEQAWYDLRDKLHTFNQHKANLRAKRLWTRLSVAAVIVLLIPAFILAYYNLADRRAQERIVVQQSKKSNHKNSLHETSVLPKNHSSKYSTPSEKTKENALLNTQEPLKPSEEIVRAEPEPGNLAPGERGTSPVEIPITHQDTPPIITPSKTVQVMVVKETPDEELFETLEHQFSEESAQQRTILQDIHPLRTNALLLSKDTELSHQDGMSIESLALPEQKSSFRPIHVGLSVAPELDRVGIASRDTWSMNAGVFTEWLLSAHLDIRFGISYSEKKYSVMDFDQQPPPGSAGAILNSFQKTLLIQESSEVRSQIIDIPLELKYTFDRSRRVRFFLAGGMSSYLYWKQSIENATDIINPGTAFRAVITAQDAEVDGKELFWLSTLNTGFGFETNLFKSIKAQVNPYYKFALRGGGSEGVQTSSFGIRTVLLYAIP